jgi:hypothetical protein
MGETDKPFTFRFVEASSTVRLELTNVSDRTLKAIEVLTIFLKDPALGNAPSQAHIRFNAVHSLKPREQAVLSHRTWINGKPTDADHDQLERLTVIPGEVRPYVLNISYEDFEGKTRFQRIPVGH